MYVLTRTSSARQLKALERLEKPICRECDSDTLRIVAFSDYRVQDISRLLSFIGTLQPAPHVILYAGDDVIRFHCGRQNLFSRLAEKATYGLCAVIGNDCDARNGGETRILRDDQIITAERALIRGRNVHNVHSVPVVIGSYAVIGSEGSPIVPGEGPLGIACYSEVSIARHLRATARTVSGKRLIIVSHAPPRGTLDSAIRFGRRNIGSMALRDFLRKHDAPLVVCGHVHSCGQQTEKCGKSVIVNAASHDDMGAPGRIAVIDFVEGSVLR